MTKEDMVAITEFLKNTPDSVRQSVSDLTDEQLRWKPSAKEFSALEHVCHLADIEREGYAVRVKRLLTEEMPLLNDIDGDRLAEERNYNGQSLDEAIARFSEARSDTLSFLKDQPLECLDNRGEFEGTGAVTLGSLLQMMKEHDRGHMKDILDLRTRLTEKQKAGVG